MSGIVSSVRKLHAEVLSNPHHRLRSWGHCHRYFRDLHRGSRSAQRDGASLHLGFFLASWGMYRGSSFLLDNDYRIHREAVRELLDPHYEPLWRPVVPTLQAQDEIAKLVVALCEALRACYEHSSSDVGHGESPAQPTDTLVTKIILGTIGCTLAYDRYVVKALRDKGIPYSAVTETNLLNVWDFYRRNSRAFAKLRENLHENGLRYPPMKLLDMYLSIHGRKLLSA